MAINPSEVSIETLADLPNGGAAQTGDEFYASREGTSVAVTLPTAPAPQNLSNITATDEHGTNPNARQLVSGNGNFVQDDGAGNSIRLLTGFPDVQGAQLLPLPPCTYDNGTQTITANANGAIVFDSYFGASGLEVGNFVLMRLGTIAGGVEDGFYVITSLGSSGAPWILTRANFASLSQQFQRGFRSTSENDGRIWTYISQNSPVLGTTVLEFVAYTVVVPVTPVVEVTSTFQQMESVGIYIANNAATVVLALPTVAFLGDTIQVTGKGSGGWLIEQNEDPVQQIFFNGVHTALGAGGLLSSTHRGDCVTLQCIVPNTTWRVIGSEGNITYV
jgi:hypothetical protein